MGLTLLGSALAAAKARGFMGIAIIDQGGTRTPFLATCLDRHGNIADPRNHETQPTPEAALEDLDKRLRPIASDDVGKGI